MKVSREPPKVPFSPILRRLLTGVSRPIKAAFTTRRKLPCCMGLLPFCQVSFGQERVVCSRLGIAELEMNINYE